MLRLREKLSVRSEALAMVNHLGPMTASGPGEHNNKTEEMNSAHNDHD